MALRLVVILLLVAGLAGCDRSGGDGAVAATPAVRADGSPPVLLFDSDLYQFGAVDETTPVTAVFEFTNAGGSELIIEDVKAGCGCTTTELDKRRYQPGERGRIEAVFTPVAPGQTRKTVTVTSNTNPPLKKLTFSANVTAFLFIEPKILQLGVLELGSEHRATLQVSSTDENFVIDSVTASVPNVSARVVPEGQATAPGPKTVEVTVASTAAWGGLYFGLDITATGRPDPGGEPVTYTRNVRVAGKLFGELSAAPDMFRFAVSPGDRIGKDIRLTRADGRPFRVLNTEPQIHGLAGATVRAEPESLGTWTIRLNATAGASLGRATGKVVVTTDVPGEEIIELRALGVIQAPRK